MAVPYIDLFKLSENDRCKYIADVLKAEPANSTEKPLVISLLLEDDEKADRYLRKIRSHFPGAREISRFKGPVPNVITLTLGGPLK